MNKLLYGVAIITSICHTTVLMRIIKMMKAAGINVVRIAESTWSTYEKQEGQFDFSTVTKVLDAMEEAGIDVTSVHRPMRYRPGLVKMVRRFWL